ncbi:MAG: GNAT family N-acetyltransferase [Candidatus Omnitrophica bacterium]|nr:GNAT family N-acetyltransferase [Candidatus Omnitrophota bacterium]
MNETADSVHIRQFLPVDKNAVRRICCDTADLGKPIENFFSDREIFGDLLTDYYTKFEPQSLWVAVVNHEVVGYLMGCLDSGHYAKVMLLRIAPKVLFKALFRGNFLRRETWRLIRTALKSLSLGGFKRDIPEKQYPAHLHIDIKEGFRHRQIGRQLMERFFQQARAKGVKGIQLSVRGDNFYGRRFFERMGFRLLGEFPMAMPVGKSYKFGQTAVYGIILFSA